jgi:hypothetical protein
MGVSQGKRKNNSLLLGIFAYSASCRAHAEHGNACNPTIDVVAHCAGIMPLSPIADGDLVQYQ